MWQFVGVGMEFDAAIGTSSRRLHPGLRPSHNLDLAIGIAALGEPIGEPRIERFERQYPLLVFDRSFRLFKEHNGLAGHQNQRVFIVQFVDVKSEGAWFGDPWIGVNVAVIRAAREGSIGAPIVFAWLADWSMF